MPNAPQVYRFGPFEADAGERVLRRDRRPVRLTPKVFDLLLVLLEHRGRLVSKDTLIERLWPETFVEESALAQAISLLRRALGERAPAQQFIETVPKHGYRFTADVRMDDGSHAAEDAAPPSGLVTRLAVLPFRTLGVAAEDSHLGLAMADALITRLSAVRALVVRPTSAVAVHGRESPFDPVAVGRALRVDVVVDGSVQRAGDRVRVNVQLVRVRDAGLIWGDGFDEPWTLIFTVQDRVAQRVTVAIAPALAGDEPGRLTAPHPRDPAAWLLYAKAVSLTHRGTPDDARRAITYFWRAIDRDPGFAQAYAGIASACCWLSHFAVAPAEAMPKARAAALTALDLDPNLAEAHYALALVRMWYDWDFAEAERAFRRVLHLAPHYPAEWFGYFLAAMGRFDEAIEAGRRAQQVDPRSLQANATLGWAFYFAQRFDEAAQQFGHAFDLDHTFHQALWGLGWTFCQRGEHRRAIDTFEQARRVVGDGVEILGGLGHAWAASGASDRATAVLAQLDDLAARQYVSPFYRALVHVALGDVDRTLACLAQACDERFEWLVHLKVDPVWIPIAADPRFQALLDRIGLTDRSVGGDMSHER